MEYMDLPLSYGKHELDNNVDILGVSRYITLREDIYDILMSYDIKIINIDTNEYVKFNTMNYIMNNLEEVLDYLTDDRLKPVIVKGYHRTMFFQWNKHPSRKEDAIKKLKFCSESKEGLLILKMSL